MLQLVQELTLNIQSVADLDVCLCSVSKVQSLLDSAHGSDTAITVRGRYILLYFILFSRFH